MSTMMRLPMLFSHLPSKGFRPARVQKEILAQFMDQFALRTRHLDAPGIMADWKRRTSTIGTRVRVETRHQIVKGRAIDVDEAGTCG